MKVTHILKDGSVRETMKGYVIPYREDTKHIYEVLTHIALECAKKKYSAQSN
ncbi:BOW99_gp33 family protein [Leuconostoc fallax]|uniref:BOW99_gp33 family protein n=1 Tax=Leuconostoc fallax TaxID=1251 RepID=UPI001C1F0658|nr:hypothetical protein [Leuconostoc fallax]MBU7455871.1 hypothetical protein [Leuconostoc fallax]